MALQGHNNVCFRQGREGPLAILSGSREGFAPGAPVGAPAFAAMAVSAVRVLPIGDGVVAMGLTYTRQ